MYNKTTGPYFQRYGTTIYNNEFEHDASLSKTTFNISNKEFKVMYKANKDVYIKFTKGILLICVSTDNGETIHDFVCHRSFLLKKNTWINFNAITPEAFVDIYYPQKYNQKEILLENPHVYTSNSNTFQVTDIYSQYYNVKSPNYIFEGEKHKFYELTYVDNGSLTSIVEGKEFIQNEYELVLYGRDCFHTQENRSDKPCSYLTIMFEMDLDDECASKIINRPIKADRTMLDAINDFVKESSLDIPYRSDLLITYLRLIIVLLLQSDIRKSLTKPVTPINQHFESELVNEIITYISNHIFEPLSIDEICKHFSISRSTLQNLFQDNLQVSPKKYINELKLQKSCLLIQEAKYSISDIALMLGYSSIHYFSRKFSHTYQISPSDYAKKIYRDDMNIKNSIKK